MNVAISNKARQDWRAVLRYLRRQFGPTTEQQAAAGLEELCAKLIENPLRGHPVKSDRHPHIRVCVLRKSLVFYRLDHDVIRIVRILDARQDPTRWLSNLAE